MILRPVKRPSLLRTRAAIGLVAGVLLVAGCASSSDSEDTEKKPPAAKSEDQLVTSLINVKDAGEPVQGGTLRIAEYSELRSLDPAVSPSSGVAGGSGLTAIYDSLMRYDWEKHEFVPQMAESLESEDDTVWTLKLRKDVKFSDGTPLNADAVIGSITRHLAVYGYSGIQWQTNVADMKKTDDLTVTITTRYPWATFPNMLSHGPGLIVAPAGYKDPKNFKAIGAGPFLEGEYKPGEFRTLVANEDYWNGRPYLDELRMTVPGGDTAKYESFTNGDADATFLRDDKLVTEAMKSTSGMRWVLGQGRNVWINVRKGRDTSMKEVRMALQYAWDPKLFMERNGEDSSLGTTGFFPENSPWYTGVEGIKPDMATAKDWVAKAKAKGWDGTLEWAHFADPVASASAVNAKAILGAAGITLELRPLNSVADQIKMMYTDHDFDLAVTGISIPQEDPYLRLAGVTDPRNFSNATGYENKELSAKLVDLAGASGPEDGLDALKEIETIWAADPPSLGISSGLWMAPWSDKVHGINPTVETMLLYDKAWIEK